MDHCASDWPDQGHVAMPELGGVLFMEAGQADGVVHFSLLSTSVPSIAVPPPISLAPSPDASHQLISRLPQMMKETAVSCQEMPDPDSQPWPCPRS